MPDITLYHLLHNLHKMISYRKILFLIFLIFMRMFHPKTAPGRSSKLSTYSLFRSLMRGGPSHPQTVSFGPRWANCEKSETMWAEKKAVRNSEQSGKRSHTALLRKQSIRFCSFCRSPIYCISAHGIPKFTDRCLCGSSPAQCDDLGGGQ